MTISRSKSIAAALCVVYFFAGCLWIDRPGLQEDEVLFAQGMFGPLYAAQSAKVFGIHVPLMQMSYLGSLKTWIWAPLFQIFGPSAAAVRVPALAAGAATIWLVFLIVLRVATPFAALASAALLAFDPLFLWLTRCDWGPVALEHLLGVAGVWLLLRFHDSSRHNAARERWLAAAFFAFGLAFWNKATFVWMAVGLVCGAAAICQTVARLALPRRIGLAALALLLGAYPLVRYNIKHRGDTLERTARFEFSRIAHKAGNLRYTLDGAGIAGFLYREGDARHPWELRRGFTHWLFGAALLAAPLVGTAGRCVALIFLGSFGLMAVTREAGESTHHLTLLWPWPHVLMGLGLGRLFSMRANIRILAPLLLVAVCGTSAAVTVTHYAQLLRNGAGPPWSDAIFPLVRTLEAHTQRGGVKELLVMDWGIIGPVRLLSGGRLPLVWAADRKEIRKGDLLVAHEAKLDQFPETPVRMEQLAAKAGCPLQTLARVHDTGGAAIFRILRCGD